MNGFNYILTKQIAWANRNNIPLVGSKITKGKQAYTKTLDQNMFELLLPETETEFKNGDGGEVKSDETKSAKMCAVHSSSALGVNILQYWKKKNIPDIAYALGLSRKNNTTSIEIKFEQKFKISNKFNFDPNIDAVIYNDENDKIKAFGIECKFSEAYSSRNHPGLKEKYITEISKHWKDIPKLFDFAKTICPNDDYFNHLHPAQLIKHILGLKNQYGKSGFRLLYLWYDVLGYEGCKHRKEIKQFSEIAKSDNIKFHSISYQELIIKMRSELYVGHEKYINYMTDRYL